MDRCRVHEECSGDDEKEKPQRSRMEPVLLEKRRPIEDGEEQDGGRSEQRPCVCLHLVLNEFAGEDDEADRSQTDPHRIGDPPGSHIGYRGHQEERRTNCESRDREPVHGASSRRRYFNRSPGRAYHQRASPSRVMTHSWSPRSSISAKQRPIAWCKGSCVKMRSIIRPQSPSGGRNPRAHASPRSHRWTVVVLR